VIRVLIAYVSILAISLAARFRTRREQAVVELALRQKLATYVIVRPETVIRRHRKGFKSRLRTFDG